MHSYHIFYFPFKWDVLSENISSSFSQRIDLDLIHVDTYSPWERVFGNEKETDYLLFNEKNYFYTFVHPVLYDTGKPGTIMQHFERKEIRERNVKYVIEVKANHYSKYELDVDDLIINLYSTGVGILIFYLKNELYADREDVLRINQFGRRIFPPFLGKQNSVEVAKERELADAIYIRGLSGSPDRYFENFENYKTPDRAWQPAKFIQSLVMDLSEDFVIIPYEGKRDVSLLQSRDLEKGVMPAIDDRMFVASLIFDDCLCKCIFDSVFGFTEFDQDFWLRYVLVDTRDACIQNEKMSRDFLAANSYLRWQKWGTIYGYSRYSFVGISSTDFGVNIAQPQYKTMYSRMFELALVQRASVLKFSGEVTRLSNLDEKDSRLIGKISDLYREYIRFVNQVYFREVTAQEQGCDMYRALQQQINLKEQVESLDNEIEELHQYATLIEDRDQNKKLGLLTKIGGMFIIPSLLVGYFGMNIFKFQEKAAGTLALSFIIGLFLTLGAFAYLLFGCKKDVWRTVTWGIIALIVLGMLALTFYIERS